MNQTVQPSPDNATALERIDRLEKTLRLLNVVAMSELAGLRMAVDPVAQLAAQQAAQAAAISSTSTTPSEMEQMLIAAGQQQEAKQELMPTQPTPEVRSEVPIGDVPFEQLPEPMKEQVVNLKRVFMTHFSPMVYEIGRGFLRPGSVLHQYEEDVCVLAPDRLIQWPAGFYRNRRTREVQFFLPFLNNAALLVIDHLPGSQAVPVIWVQENQTRQWRNLILCQFAGEDAMRSIFANIGNAIAERLRQFSDLESK